MIIYFIRPICDVEDAPIKIGCSRNFRTRLEEFEFSGPFPLEVLATVDGSFGHENRLHAAFAADWLHHEWFSPSIRLRELIEAAKAIGLEPAMLKMGIPLLSPHEIKSRAWRRREAA